MKFKFEDVQDMLNEFGSIGSGNVSTVFSEIFDRNFDISIKEFGAESTKEKKEVIHSLLDTKASDNFFMVSRLSGLLDGAVIFNFKKDRDYKFSLKNNIISYVPDKADELEKVFQEHNITSEDILYEVFNISTSYYLSAISNLLHEKISISEFEFNKNEANLLESITKNIDDYLCVESSIVFKETNQLIGNHLFIVSRNSLDKALSKFRFSKVLLCRKVLLCDDTSFMRVLLKGIIQQKYPNIVIEETNNGCEAIEKYKKLNPDLVVMDLVMPGCDGITATKSILSYDPNAKIVFTSGSVLKIEVIRAFNAGGKDFIAKPYDDNERVLTTINKFLK